MVYKLLYIVDTAGGLVIIAGYDVIKLVLKDG